MKLQRTHLAQLLVLATLWTGFLVDGTTSSLTGSRRELLAKKEKKRKADECPRSYAPYVSSIRDANGEHYCGGIVIAEDAVLTSASCVDRRIKRKVIANPIIHIGGKDSENPVQKRMTEAVFVHEKWDGNPLHGYDLAILKLDKPTCVWPVKYIGKRDAKQWTFLVFGFGRTGSRGKFSTRALQGSNVTFVSGKDCVKKLDVPINDDLGETCFRSTTGGSAICTGDEGGPIMHAPFSPVYEDSLIAVSSYIVGNCAETGSVAVATDVRRYRKWIQKTIASKEFRGIKKDKKKKKSSKKKTVKKRISRSKNKGKKTGKSKTKKT